MYEAVELIATVAFFAVVGITVYKSAKKKKDKKDQ